MIHYMVKGFAVIAAVMFLSITVLEATAHARAGGGRSSGSRSYSRPAPSYSPQGTPRQQYAPAPGPVQQQAGGFMRNMAGGLAGGVLGSMLFSSFAGAGAGGGLGSGTGGGGIGLFEIILLAGGGYLLYRYLHNKRTANAVKPYERR